MFIQNNSDISTLALEMDYYHPNGDSYHSMQDMLAVDMDMSTDNMYHQRDPNKRPLSHSPVGSGGHMPQDTYSNCSHNGQMHYTPDDHHMDQLEFPPHGLSPKRPDLDMSGPNPNWLQTVGSGMHPHGNCNPGLIVSPSSPLANGNHSIQNQSLSTIRLSLPNNVQISGGNVNYVSMPSATQQVYIRSCKPVMATHSQQSLQMVSDSTDQHGYRSRSNSNNYMVSPNSVPSSTVMDNPFPKPPYSYSCLIAMALKNSKHGSLPVAEIYNFMIRHFPYFKTAPDGWKNSVRHNLSLNKCFEKIENPNADGTNSRKGCLWALNPAKVKKMDEEIFKWNKKDPMAIKRAMAHPEILDMLSKGEEAYLAVTNVKPMSGQGRQSVQPRLHQQHQPIHHMQQHSPHHSPPHSNRMMSDLPSPMMVHTTCSVGMTSQTHPIHNGQHQNNKAQMMMELASSDLFDANGDLMLDPALSEINIQSGAWDGLPSNLLDIPFSNSPTTFLISPKKVSPAVSPGAVHHAAETPALATNTMQRGMLITLGQN